MLQKVVNRIQALTTLNVVSCPASVVMIKLCTREVIMTMNDGHDFTEQRIPEDIGTYVVMLLLETSMRMLYKVSHCTGCISTIARLS